MMLEPFAHALHRCAVCHDQCFFATVEVFASGRQTLATSRKAMLLEAVRRDQIGWTPSLVDVVYAGLNSGVQHAFCVWRGNDAEWPDETLYLRAARADIVQKGLAPPWAHQYRDRWRETGNPYGLTEDPLPRSGRTVLFADAASRALQPESLAIWLEIANHFETDVGQLSHGSSGFELLDLGYVDDAQEAATSLCKELADLAPGLIVCDAPEPVYMLNHVWSEWGLALPAPVVHSSTWLSDTLQDRQVQLPLKGSRLTFQDPACLARYLKITEAPRAILNRLGISLVEMLRHHEEALPSGSYYGNHPSRWMQAIGQERVASAQATGAEGIVTCSPFDNQNLRGFALPVMDLGEIVVRQLQETTELLAPWRRGNILYGEGR